MGHVKMAGPGFVNDVTAWWPGTVIHLFLINQTRMFCKSGENLEITEVWMIEYNLQYVAGTNLYITNYRGWTIQPNDHIPDKN
jgi:hypothetical protein